MANITAPTLSFKFDQSSFTGWPASDANDHAESMVQQFNTNAKQGRENPWYGMYQGSAIPKLCGIFSGRDSNLRLESAPVSELYFDTMLQPNDLARITDPDYLEISDEREEAAEERQDAVHETQDADSPASKPRMSRELDQLLRSAQDYAPSGSKKDRRDNAKRNTAPVSQRSTGPDSQSSAASVSSAPKKVRIVRATDGMVFARAKLSYLREKLSIPDRPTLPGISSVSAVPAIPVISLELKVPHWTGPTYLINPYIAHNTLHRALPQIVQHAQFIFHAWKHITIIWALGVCGRFVIFYKFLRSTTPEIEPVRISSGEYYAGTKPADEVPTETSDVIELVDRDGKYTPEFQQYWKDVLANAEEQYARVDFVKLTTP